MKLSSGTQFDPKVVEVFVRLHAEGRIHFSQNGSHHGEHRHGNGRAQGRLTVAAGQRKTTTA
jgi:HD-GYP domain-containing protein (c-di-GMP phosphodiesterase class II)